MVLLRPRVVVEQSYTDNFFLDPNRKVNMFVTRVAPGLNLKALTGNTVVLLDYLVGHHWHFTDEPGINAADQNFWRHDLSLGVATQASEHWRLGLTEELIKSREPLLAQEAVAGDDDLPPVDPERPADFFNLRANLIDYTRNRVKPFATYYFSDRWEAKLGYRNEVFSLSSENPDIDALLEDQMEHRGILTLTFNPAAGHHFDLESQYWHRDFSAADPSFPLNSDYNAYQTKIIYRRDISGSPYEFQAGGGYQLRDFTQDIIGQQMDSISEFVFSTELSRKTPVSKVILSLERTINDLTISNSYYASHTLRLSAQRLVYNRRFRLFGRAGFTFNDYLTSDLEITGRRDNLLEFEGGIAYRFLENRMELSLGYGYNDRDSNKPDFDYTENRVFLKLEARYDLGPFTR